MTRDEQQAADEGIDVARGQAKVNEILHADKPARKRRSDFGSHKPKVLQLGVTVKIPGATFDLGYPDARSLLESAIATWASKGNDADNIWNIIEQLLAKIAELQAKQAAK